MSGRKRAREKNEQVYLTATTNSVAQAYPRIEMGELRRLLREGMKEANKEAIGKERAA